jgi:hypothetical protein
MATRGRSTACAWKAKATLIGATILALEPSNAQDFPTTGLLFNARESHSVTYQCAKTGDVLRCDFIQTAVRKKASSDSLQKALQQAVAEVPSDKKRNLAGECKTARDDLEIIEGKRPPLGRTKPSSFSPIEKTDALAMVKAIADYSCDGPTEEKGMQIARLLNDKKSRTCTVSSVPYSQAFELVRDPASGARTWVVKANPEGPCGLLQLSRFEPEVLDGSKREYWSYFARRATTNPKGRTLLGSSCSGYDETEYKYDWRPKEWAMQCDYIEFDVL